jgi:hypothetical protein
MPRSLLTGFSLLLLCVGSLLLASCSTPTSPLTKDPVPKTVAPGLGGAQLWSQNCAHCHNVRAPDSYSDTQWEVVMLHMRVRANLTADEGKKILVFLKSAH